MKNYIKAFMAFCFMLGLVTIPINVQAQVSGDTPPNTPWDYCASVFGDCSTPECQAVVPPPIGTAVPVLSLNWRKLPKLTTAETCQLSRKCSTKVPNVYAIKNFVSTQAAALKACQKANKTNPAGCSQATCFSL